MEKKTQEDLAAGDTGAPLLQVHEAAQRVKAFAKAAIEAGANGATALRDTAESIFDAMPDTAQLLRFNYKFLSPAEAAISVAKLQGFGREYRHEGGETFVTITLPVNPRCESRSLSRPQEIDAIHSVFKAMGLPREVVYPEARYRSETMARPTNYKELAATAKTSAVTGAPTRGVVMVPYGRELRIDLT